MRKAIEMIKDLKTPYYLFDEDELTGRVRNIQEALSECNSELCFAIKANPFLIPLMDHVISKYEVCSPGELEICRKYGVAGKKIVFSGVVKSLENMVAALNYPVGVITIESARHWQLLQAGIKITGRRAKVLLRLTSGAQFGMEEEDIRKILREIEKTPEITLAGIHFFAGTQRKGKKYEKELPVLAELMESLSREFELEDQVLEYGPGLSVPYFTGDDFDAPLQSIRELASYIKNQNYPFRTVIEMGRYIAASCGYYVTKIVDMKKAQTRNYCLVDGGIHHVNYYGQNMAMRTPVIHHITDNKMHDGKEEEYMICGALCTFADILVRGLTLSDPQIGDRLVFQNIGAYSVTEGSYLFLSRDLPAVYAYGKEKGLSVLREREETWEINSGLRSKT